MNARVIIRIGASLLLAGCAAWLPALSLKAIPRGTVATYSADGTVSVPLSLRVQSDGYIGSYAVVFTLLSLGPQPAAPAQAPVMQLWKPGASPLYRLALDGAPSSPDQVLGGSFTASTGSTGRTSHDFAFVVPALPLPPPGTYTAQVRADLYPTTFLPSGTPADTATFDLNVSVGQNLAVSVVPSGGAFSVGNVSLNLDFGMLTAGTIRQADAIARTNVSYSLTLSSANGWALANTGDGSLVPYHVSVNGTRLTAQTGQPLALATAVTPSYGQPARYALTFTLGTLPQLPTEGAYADNLTVTVTAP